jgi:hypothetical protein
MVRDVGQQMIGIVLFVWTRVKKLMESHIRTFAHDQIRKTCYFWPFLRKSLTFWPIFRISSLDNRLCWSTHVFSSFRDNMSKTMFTSCECLFNKLFVRTLLFSSKFLAKLFACDIFYIQRAIFLGIQ